METETVVRRFDAMRRAVAKRPRAAQIKERLTDVRHDLIGPPRVGAASGVRADDPRGMAAAYAQQRVLVEERRVAARAALDAAHQQLLVAREHYGDHPRAERRFRNPLAPYAQAVARAQEELDVAQQFCSDFIDHRGRAVPRQYLTLVPSTRISSGQAVEVFGDLAEAKHVIIMVPGACNRFHTFHETRAQSEVVARHAALEYPHAPVAVIEWMGYVVPGWVRGALPHPANHGGPALAAFVDSLGLAPDVEVTAVGHSYGSIVLSEALRNGLHAARVVFLGSPGVHAGTADELGIDARNVFALAAERDMISRLRWHGTNPVSEPFGAVRLATEGIGHSSYFEPGNLSLRNLVHVALGRVDRVVEFARAGVMPAPESELSLAR